ncbi:MAG: iron-sulfur cluster assembly accessory protein [Gammaproteobacteria bacterium]|nr:iron-sulfur cluster assembly accessory protein [Gammaproteobacteria bacterium]MDH3411182.1 iron-sulfur cluster assembly accessory protein [Gammaproteobacteria bacterium]
MSQESIPAFKHDISDEEMTVTAAAREQLTRLFGDVEDEEIEAIRIYVAGGGCSGMTYGMTFTDHKSELDKVLKGDGYEIYVDAVALNYLQGVEIDYVARDTGATFVFNNVFQSVGGSATCGACGAAVGAGGGCG